MNLTDMIEAGSANPLMLFLFSLVLGALHGLEPGHSKTMMAAYIIAVQGTVKQAVLLGVSAAFSHSIIVWGLAMLALTLGNEMIGEALEPWFVILSGVLVLGIGLWMLWQARRATCGHSHSHHHEHHHDHEHGHSGSSANHHHHGYIYSEEQGRDALENPAMDAHARAHAFEIRARIADGRRGTWQTILFGLTGGLIPCPGAITVFILCLHLGKLTLGVTLVAAFSLGLAVTLVSIGVVAAIGLRAITARTSRFDNILRAAPWISAALIIVIGALIIWSGISHFHQAPHLH